MPFFIIFLILMLIALVVGVRLFYLLYIKRKGGNHENSLQEDHKNRA